MHKYLSAVGFKHVKSRTRLNRVLDLSEKSFEIENTLNLHQKPGFSERRKYFAKDMGLMVCGTYDDDENFEREYYIPFFSGRKKNKFEDLSIERHIERNSYAGAFEFSGIGISVIYYLQNTVDYISEMQYNHVSQDSVSLTLSGLAVEGKILLPVMEEEKGFSEQEESFQRHSKLLKEAMAGDEKAIENLTMEEMDTYSMISRRIETEDILSIVSTYFMPYGLECDQYSILAEILRYEIRENYLTKEKIYVLTVSCNGLEFDVCINQEDLLGEPEIGRRLKANIWLQGILNFEEEKI